MVKTYKFLLYNRKEVSIVEEEILNRKKVFKN